MKAETKDIKDFIAGKWVQRFEYKSFTPEYINQQWQITDPGTIVMLSEANRLLGKLDAYSTLIPDINFFIKMHIAKEATVSSKIEGTQTTFEEAVAAVEFIDPEKRDDWQEVNNYIIAINYAMDELKTLPISNRLIRQTHELLLSGVRGQYKSPGDFRTSQNWIGASLKNAIFVPPGHEEIPDLMRDLEMFINADVMRGGIHVPHLIIIALAHYQFETIHPFLDGNGRIGRLLITLYLVEKNLLRHPALYLSHYFEKNRFEYYDKLTLVRTQNRLSDWINFFLQGVIETAESSIYTFEKIIELRAKIEGELIPTLGKKQQDAITLIRHLYKTPVMDGVQIAQAISSHASTANRMIKNFLDLGILAERTGYKRNRIYVFDPYVKLFA